MTIETPSGGPPSLPSSGKTDSTWMAIGRFARSAPWTSTGASLLVLAAVGVLAGVDPLFIRILLTWSLGLLAAAWVLLWLVRRADNSTLFDRPESGTATAASNEKATPGMSWYIWGICLAATIGNVARQQPFRPAFDPKPQLLQVERREATSRHWNATVTRLHKIRFDQSISDSISASEHSRQAIELLRVGLGEALSASTEKVDPDLLRMTQRHLKIDHQSLALTLKIKEWWEKNGSVGGQNPATKNIDAFSHFLENASEAEVDKLPADLQEFLRQFLENERLYDQMLQEVLVMQITLQERYKPAMFPLPPIAAD